VDVATVEEVVHAIQSLTEADYDRLAEAAKIRMVGSAYTDPRDLVNDAVLTPYRAVLGQGGRRWKPEVDFIKYLFMTIKGLASDSRRSAEHRLTDSHRQLVREDGGERDFFESPDVATPSVERSALEEERHAERRRIVAKVQAAFAIDEQIQWIMMGIEEGMSAEEIQELSSMTRTEYETAHRRWRRGLAKVVPGRRQS